MKLFLHLILLLLNLPVVGQIIRVTDGSPLMVQSRLHLSGIPGAINQSGLRLANLPYTTDVSAPNRTKFLTVDEEGNVILGSLNSNARLAADSTGLWRSVGSYLQNSSVGGVIIGEGINYKPTGYNLYVSQGILTEKLKVAIKTTNDWSDKVFNPTYKLWALSKVKRYIDQFHHLPGVDSADQVVQEGGVDVGRMEAKLLEKLEEVTLYLIQHQKELEQLRQENQQLKGQILKLQQKALR